ncbi:ABC transporter substrate-binding protein [Paenibacillus solisilvae]|uniref:ABC transporter substrate-binding protein n=1 Tax=Paenibacillus solisilvae TaxID=2486751 RepID=A0ABW0VY11_9BACL
MRSISKVNMWVCISMLLALAVTGCSAPTASSGGGQAAALAANAAGLKSGGNGEPQMLSVLIKPFANDVEKAHWNTIVKAFEDKNKDIKVQFATGDVSVESGKLTTMLNSGVTPPDTIMINAGPARVGVLSKANLIIPMDDIYKKYNWQDKLNPFAYNLVSFSGKIYELPHGIDYNSIGFNKDIFQKVGAKLPTTPEEFYTSMDQMKKAGYVPIALGTRVGFGISGLYGQMLEAVAGTEAVEGLFFGDSKWTDPPFLKTTELLKEWADKGVITKEAVSLSFDDQKAIFIQKKATMTQVSNYHIGDFIAANVLDTVGITPFPVFTPGLQPKPTGGIGFSWVIPVGAKHKDLAEKWLNFIVDDYTDISYKDPNYNNIPATKRALEITPAGPILAEMVKGIKQGVGYHPTLFIGPEAKNAFLQNLPGVITGLVTPQQAMENIQAGKMKDIEAGYKLKK